MAKKKFDIVPVAQVPAEFKVLSIFGTTFDFSDHPDFGTGHANATDKDYYFPANTSLDDWTKRGKNADLDPKAAVAEIVESALREQIRNRTNEKPVELSDEDKKAQLLKKLRALNMTPEEALALME
jgi:hypothetical protein